MASRLNPPLALLALLLAPPLYVAAQGPGALPPPAGPPLVPLQRVELDARASAAAAVVPDAPLIHTAQLVPAAFRDGAAAQLDQLLLQLQALLRSRGSDLPHVAKLNLYVAREELGGEVLRAAAARFQGEQQPAVSLVATALPHREALVALDAVALAPARSAPAVRRGADAAILPAGSRIYVSGQAEPGTLREATRKTLQSLAASLRHCGRTPDDIVQLKCFLQPMASVGEVREEIARHFDGAPLPPTSFVEWRMAAPIEIELVAWGGPANQDAAEPLEFLTPPELKPSPLFSRIARIHRGGTIYFGDLHGAADASAEEQAQAPFDQLKRLLAKTGCDLAHLAKATYYVTGEEVSRAHNAIRPKYYDPARPPAASKAVVAGTGRAGVRYAMDMIAVPSSRGTPASGPEHGHGLSAAEAAAGWLSLFDGATAFGWKGAHVEAGTLRGGETTSRYGSCELRAAFASAGTITIGGKDYGVKDGAVLNLRETGERGPIRLSENLALQALVVRPLGVKPLFNGRDLSGWRTIERGGPTDKPSPFWRVEGSVLRAVGGPGAIEYTGGELGDFLLQIDVRSRAVHSNGGVFIRSVPGEFMNGYEAQLHNRCLEDDPARPYRYTTGGIDDRQDARRLVGRDFVTLRMTVLADGPHLATWVNGVQTTDWTDDRPLHDNPRQGQRLKAGALQLQAHDPDTDFEVHQILIAH